MARTPRCNAKWPLRTSCIAAQRRLRRCCAPAHSTGRQAAAGTSHPASSGRRRGHVRQVIGQGAHLTDLCIQLTLGCAGRRYTRTFCTDLTMSGCDAASRRRWVRTWGVVPAWGPSGFSIMRPTLTTLVQVASSTHRGPHRPKGPNKRVTYDVCRGPTTNFCPRLPILTRAHLLQH